jgi:opacity protein-like surface antigen
MRSLACAVVAAAALGLPASAQSMYLKVGGGVGQVEDSDAGPRVQVAVGRRLESGPRVELEAIGSFNEPEFGDEFGSVGLLANVLFDLELNDRVSAFAGAGGGIGYTKLDNPFSDDATGFAGQGLAGISLQIADNVAAEIGARYVAWPEPDGVSIETSSVDAMFNLRFER